MTITRALNHLDRLRMLDRLCRKAMRDGNYSRAAGFLAEAAAIATDLRARILAAGDGIVPDDYRERTA